MYIVPINSNELIISLAEKCEFLHCKTISHFSPEKKGGFYAFNKFKSVINDIKRTTFGSITSSFSIC